MKAFVHVCTIEIRMRSLPNPFNLNQNGFCTCDFLAVFAVVFPYTLMTLGVNRCHDGLGPAGPPLDVDLTDI